MEIMRIAEGLNEDEQRVLLECAKGLKRGQERIGFLDLASDDRDWDRELREEMIDGCIYAACEAVRYEQMLQQRRGIDEPPIEPSDIAKIGRYR